MTDTLTFIHKTILGFKPIKYTPLWWWYRLICHQDLRLDDRHLIHEFWSSLNQGWEQIEYIRNFELYWGKGSYPPERIILSETDYDNLRERLLEPPDPEAQERIQQIMERIPPWEQTND